MTDLNKYLNNDCQPQSLTVEQVTALGLPVLNYYKVEEHIYAGEYPFAANQMFGIKKLDVLKSIGVTTIIDLTECGELFDYSNIVSDINHYKFPIKDRNIPDSFENVYKLMSSIDNAKSENSTIYIHCWGGVGRTGTIVACWLVYNGMAANEALAHLNELWKSCPKSKRRPYCPDHGCQIDFIKQFELYIKNPR